MESLKTYGARYFAKEPFKENCYQSTYTTEHRNEDRRSCGDYKYIVLAIELIEVALVVVSLVPDAHVNRITVRVKEIARKHIKPLHHQRKGASSDDDYSKNVSDCIATEHDELNRIESTF